jgi:hypothetical protein
MQGGFLKKKEKKTIRASSAHALKLIYKSFLCMNCVFGGAVVFRKVAVRCENLS